MKRKSRIIAAWMLLGLMTCSALSTGCIIGGNTSVSFIVPMGFGGAPGVYNPFGIVQAVVNALLGAGGSGGSASPNPVPGSSSSIGSAIPSITGATAPSTPLP